MKGKKVGPAHIAATLALALLGLAAASHARIMRWITTTNHKDVGTLYLWFSFIMFLTGGVMALVIRAELFSSGLQIVDPDFFNQMVTMHGLIMVFGAIMPAFVGFANWQIPMMIGAPDMAFTRLNNWQKRGLAPHKKACLNPEPQLHFIRQGASSVWL